MGNGSWRSVGTTGDVDRGIEAKLVNMFVNIKEDDMGGRDNLGKLDKIRKGQGNHRHEFSTGIYNQ